MKDGETYVCKPEAFAVISDIGVRRHYHESLIIGNALASCGHMKLDRICKNHPRRKNAYDDNRTSRQIAPTGRPDESNPGQLV